VDKGLFSQVIHNLVLNARQSMPKGGTIEIVAKNVPKKEEITSTRLGGDCIKISIKDEGAGIKKEHLKKIFEPYFTTKDHGIGLGLSSAFSIINKHDGSIDFETQLGKGTIFNIYLPATKNRIQLDVKKKLIRQNIALKILFMDDDNLIRYSIPELLRMNNHEVTEAKDGNEAISLFERAKNSNRPYDVVILDLTVREGMGGSDAIKRMLEIDPETKAIVSSGYFDDPVMSNFRKYGFKGSISKPYNIDELNDLINSIEQRILDGSNKRS